MDRRINGYNDFIITVTGKKEYLLPLNAEDIETIDEFINSLGTMSGRSYTEVLKLRFGMTGKKHTYREMGERFGVSYEAIRLQVQKAIRLLRHPTRVKFFKKFYKTSPEEEPLKKSPSVLSMSVDELDLSVRAYNCLKNLGIKTVAELVQKTEYELLQAKNFGIKSLLNLKDALNQLNLRLGMRKMSRSAEFGMYVVLLVEDNPKEAEKGIKAVKEKGCITSSASLTSPIGSVSNLEEFKQHLNNPEVVWDGVITDLYLTEEPLGLEVALECKKQGIPCVICTDKYSHADSQWWYKIAKELGAELEVGKDWEAAVDKLVELIKS